LRIKAAGICGSDLHGYQDGRIGDTDIPDPLVIGHEFSATVLSIGQDALDGNFQPLRVGQRVAVDPTIPCYRCELCEKGHPNLCTNHTFCGLPPVNGAFQEMMVINAELFPDTRSDQRRCRAIEPLGIAMHRLIWVN
jgi:L-iditol 2-dehydrogenase